MNSNAINPELRKAFSRMFYIPFHYRLLQAFMHKMSKRMVDKKGNEEGVIIENITFGERQLRLYRPESKPVGAGLFWIHGGGYILGAPPINDRQCAAYARTLNLVVVSPVYGLAPQNPFPAGLDDCHAAWNWFTDNAEDLGVDPKRIVLTGQSAGGGLAASLAQKLLDVGDIQPCAQALFYPMLDDRTAVLKELDNIKHKLWRNSNNRGAWGFYLGQEPGKENVPNYSVPARREDLSGLPPAWIGVGDIDLFYNESVTYAERLQASGVSCQLDIYQGAPHAFELIAEDAPISQRCWQDNYRFIKNQLNLD